MAYELDYFGNLIIYNIEGDVDQSIVIIESTSKPLEDESERKDIEFHCLAEYHDMAYRHYMKTGEPL